MARPRSFDPDDVLEIARQVFWQKGFQATSLDEITAASGIATELYAAFATRAPCSSACRPLPRRHSGLGRAHAGAAGARPRAVRQWLTGFIPCVQARRDSAAACRSMLQPMARRSGRVRHSIERYNRRLDLLRARLRAGRDEFGRALILTSPRTPSWWCMRLLALAHQRPDARQKAVIDQVMGLPPRILCATTQFSDIAFWLSRSKIKLNPIVLFRLRRHGAADQHLVIATSAVGSFR